MVFEDLVRPRDAKKHPKMMFFLGLLFSLLAVAFGLFLFPGQTSLVIVFLVVIMCVPLMYFTLRQEEEQDLKIDNEFWLLREHGKAINFLMYLFFGLVVGFTLFYVFSPEKLVNEVFNLQLNTIKQINGNLVSGAYILDSFFAILFNNLKVLLFCLLFAVFFGAGAIFILTWNASVISAAVGTYVRNGLAESVSALGFSKLSLYFQLILAGLFRYMLHGVFEIVAYFIGGLAGGLISMAVVNKKVRLVKLKRVI